jgi:hypothetical protein
VACEEPPPPPLPEPVSLDDVGDAPAAGSIDGAPWELEDARFRIERREGRERVDLFLWDRPVERCGLPIARAGTHVWLRVPGRTELEVGELATGDGDDALSAHYERLEGDTLVTAHRATARLRIEAVEPRRVRGRLRACFADEERSCVEGTFDAAPCWSRVDGRAIREPPGLTDEALDPVRRTGGPTDR